jgi:hypothetical protein
MTQTPLKQNYARTDKCTHARIQVGRQTEGLNLVAGKANDQNE